jgi:hypothetical protein
MVHFWADNEMVVRPDDGPDYLRPWKVDQWPVRQPHLGDKVYVRIRPDCKMCNGRTIQSEELQAPAPVEVLQGLFGRVVPCGHETGSETHLYCVAFRHPPCLPGGYVWLGHHFAASELEACEATN